MPVILHTKPEVRQGAQKLPDPPQHFTISCLLQSKPALIAVPLQLGAYGARSCAIMDYGS